ncbi:MAG: translational GTPase TypA [Thermoguttaceae bacterium]|nr:translational GTPase TypA [Thermoguttaceae bacterium]
MAEQRDDIRNIAIIAHVDHGKTTLVDCLLKQCSQMRDAEFECTQILDSNDLERERGITILAKNIALNYKGVKINIMDTPGHADFGGEVERVLRMADGCLVLVDAAEGPMPQTRFVLSKALEIGLKPIVLINKIDRKDARPQEVVNEMFDLFINLGADEDIADFPYLFSSTKEGYATADPNVRTGSIVPLLDMILEKIPGPTVEMEKPLQMLVTTIDWSEFVGRIAIGRVQAGTLRKGQTVTVMQKDDQTTNGKVAILYTFNNLGKNEVHEADAGDIAAIVGLPFVEIGDTICSPSAPVAMPRIHVDDPTLRMTFGINTSPLAGKEGKYVTTRHVRDRLMRELERNVALRVEPVPQSDQFLVSGRGILHLSVLIETMRREGYEFSVGKPEVINKTIDGVVHEPYETLLVEVPADATGPVMELVGQRFGELLEVSSRGDFQLLTFTIPARGLIGLRTRMLNATKGTAIMNHRFECYKPKAGEIPTRNTGVLISNSNGNAVAFALDALQGRGDMFVEPNDILYEGMIVGEHCRAKDLTVNPIKEKKLTNMRASGSDRNIILKPARKMTLEEALEFIEDDELVECTPKSIRMRKILLTENERRKAGRASANDD